MTTEASFVSSPWSDKAPAAGLPYSAEDLEALHTYLTLEFRSMAAQHRPGCAFIAPFPNSHDLSPNEILVIPANCDAALFSVAFLSGERTTMVIRIGEHGVWECSGEIWDCSEDARPTGSLAATAKLLFGAALRGRYREEIWTDVATGRYEGGQSFFMDDDCHGWQELGCRCQPRISSRLLRHKLSVLDRRYEPY